MKAINFSLEEVVKSLFDNHSIEEVGWIMDMNGAGLRVHFANERVLTSIYLLEGDDGSESIRILTEDPKTGEVYSSNTISLSVMHNQYSANKMINEQIDLIGTYTIIIARD